MRFSVQIVDLASCPHAHCFVEFAEALRGALTDLGHEVTNSDHPILLGANDPNRVVGDSAILYNAEQIAFSADPRACIAPSTLDRVIWDYSAANVQRWRELGFKNVHHVPVGYHPSMERGWPRVPENIDVLFYGAMSRERQEILTELRRAGLGVKHLFGVYGEERDVWVARAKVVLNLHYYRGIFEVFRCSHLWANRKCVVTESQDGPCDLDLEALARITCACVPRSDLVSTCRALVDTPAQRRGFAERGYAEFKAKTSLAENLRAALEAL